MQSYRCDLGHLKGTLCPPDALIASASFESRCLSIAGGLDLSKCERTLIACLDSRPGATGEHLEELLRLSNGRGAIVPLASGNPLESADVLSNALDKLLSARPACVAIDVSTFTHETLLVLYRILSARRGTARLIYLYCGVKEYSVGDSVERKWLSRGTREVRSVVGYPGDLRPSRAIHLILLGGFEYERAIGLVREFEPSHVSLGYGDKTIPFTTPHQPANEHAIDLIQRTQSIASRVERFNFDPYSPIDTYRAVSEQWKRHPNMNAVLAPLNTKLSTLGVGRFAMDVDVVQVCYSEPLVYNVSRYSDPSP